ncbi:MAG: response regulator [Desulfuromonadales bacterium]|nr:response regulator [Desulfuromonadales bacterium]
MKLALVVDDEPLIRRQVRETLETYGFARILEVEDGPQAVSLAQLHQPSLIIIEASLSDQDGISVAEKIGKLVSVPIVMLMTSVDTETVERVRLAGVQTCLAKPFNSGQLMLVVDLAIHRFLEVSSLRGEVARLQEELKTRKVVEKAKGVLVRQGLSEAQAYRKLQKIAMNRRKSLKDVAGAVLMLED